MKRIILFFYFFCLFFPLYAQVGNIDPAFSTVIQDISFSGEADQVFDMVVQPDGKYLVVGTVYDVGIYAYVARFNTNGTFDATFGSGGIATLSVRELYAISLQSDGKIVAVGQDQNPSTLSQDFVIIRLNTNGTVDNTFGTSGIVYVDFSGNDDLANDVVVQSDGKIVVVGEDVPGTFAMAVARLNSNGSLDTGFGTGGKVTENFGFSAAANAVALQADGKIVVVGRMFLGDQNFAILRLNANGTKDNTFSGDGLQDINVVADDEANNVSIQIDGKIVVVGSTDVGVGSDYGVIRLNSNGSLDTGFATGGIGVYSFPGSVENIANTVFMQPDGKILVAGSSAISSSFRFSILRLTSTGSLDTSFSLDGFQNFAIGGDVDEVTAMALQADGKIVLCGISDQGSTNDDLVLMRLLAEPIYTVINTQDSGYGSLRAAITNANSNANAQTIDFKIPGISAFTINLSSPLPTITEILIIDGTTQPNWTPTNRINLNGSAITNPTRIGLDIQADGCEIYGLEIFNFSGGGTNDNGIRILNADNVTIGAVNKGNVLRNNNRGIALNNATNCIIVNNYIGTNNTGTASSGNLSNGILLTNSDGNIIGGNSAGLENIISGNGDAGIRLNDSDGNSIIGNYIGVDASGNNNLGNTGDGIYMVTSSFNTIGGTLAGEPNIIAYNTNDGVTVEATAGVGNNNAIRRNSIFCNSANGITLLNGANESKLAPTISSASTTQVSGSCIGCANGETVEVFIDNEACTVASKQGRTYLGSATVASSAWTLTSANFQTALLIGNVVTATITSSTGNTSRFSNQVTVGTQAPVLAAAQSGNASFIEAGGAIVVSPTGLGITDADNTTLTEAIISISNFVNGEDLLALSLPQAGISSAIYTPSTGILQLTGNGTLAQWTDALRNVTYNNTSGNPTTTTRTINFQVNDGTNVSNTVSRNVTITAVNTAPTLSATTTGTLFYDEGSAPVVISPTGLNITDPDNTNLSQATVFISANFQLGADILALPSPGTWATVNYNASTGTLTISGNGTLAQYKTELNKVTFANSSANPSTALRTISFRLNDGQAVNNLSNIVTRDIQINAVNQAPIITEGSSILVTMSEDSAPIPFTLTLNATDGDNTGAELNWSIAQQATNGTASATGTGNTKVINYTPTSDFNGTDNFFVQVSDGIATAEISVTVSILSVNDAPTIDAIPSPQNPVNINSNPVTLNLTGITTGASNEVGQTISITAISDRPNLIPNPTISYTSPNNVGLLTYQVIANVSLNVNVTITVSIRDNGGVTNGGIDSTIVTFVVPVSTKTPAPSQLVATTLSVSEIRLNWKNNTTTATGFEIQRTTSLSGGFTTVATLMNGSLTGFTDTGLQNNTEYFYRVKALSNGGSSDWSNIAGATTGNVANAPTNLTATALAFNRIQLNWTDNSNNETSFTIERASVFSDFFYEKLVELPANSTSYVDTTNIFGNNEYFYRVRADNNEGNSVYSNEAVVTTPFNQASLTPKAPTNLSAKPVSESQINLRWEYPIDPTVVYTIERSDDGVNFIVIDQVVIRDLIAQKTYFDIDPSLVAGTEYCYRVRASTSGGNSPYSNIACATPSCNLVLAVIRSDDGSQVICEGKTAAMTISQQIFNASYQWKQNGEEIPGATFDVFYASETGLYTCDVTVGNCNANAINEVLVVVLGTPNSIVITQVDDLLIASVQDANQYQWFHNYQPIQGATNFFYKPTRSGVYFVSVSVDNCSSTSEIFEFDITTHISEDISNVIKVSPNPTEKELNIQVEHSYLGAYEIILLDFSGRKYSLQSGQKEVFSFQKTIDVAQFASGLYWVEIRMGRYRGLKKIMKF